MKKKFDWADLWDSFLYVFGPFILLLVCLWMAKHIH